MTGPGATPRRAPRPPLLGQGLGAALVAGVLALASLPGAGPLVALVLVAQVLLVLAVLALVEAPGDTGIVVVAGAATAAADAVALLGDGEVAGLAGVVALSLVAAFVVQLARRRRDRVTEALADTVLVVLLVCAACCLVALRVDDGGREAVAVALAAAGAALLAGRVGDRVAARPRLAVGATRGWPGLVLGLGSGVAAAALVAGRTGEVAGPRAALLGLAVAAAVCAADLVVDLAAAELRDTADDRRRVAALRPVGLLLPYAALGPVALVAGRLALS